MTTTNPTLSGRLVALKARIVRAWPFPFVTPAAFGATPPPANRG
jgi:hypothetical protein